MLLAVYYAVLGILAVYGLHRFVLLVALWRSRGPAGTASVGSRGLELVDDAELPRVTVQLPIYNERYVAPQLVLAVLDLDYPTDRLEIQVLDDSTDDTTERIHALLEDAATGSRRLPRVRCIRRSERDGFKAGALQHGLETAEGELIAIFDADFVPGRDFLRRTVPAFGDPEVGMVQARWDHLNRYESLFTGAQAVLLDGHFLVEQEARYRSGCFFNFNGTAGVWRREAIDDAGGWRADTLTEDLDLSYRSQLAGWRFKLLTDFAVPAVLPARANDFKSQQHRWAYGSAQTMRKLLGRILRSPVRLRVKLAAAAHLTSGFCYPLLVALGLLLVPAILIREESPRLVLWVDAPLFLLGTVAVAACYVVGQRRAGRRGLMTWLEVPFAMSVGIGLSLHNAAAVVKGLVRRGGVFSRTPKVPPNATDPPAPYRSSAGWSLWGEAILAVYFWVCFFAVGVNARSWSLPFIFLFAQGYSLIALGGAFPRFGQAVRQSAAQRG